MSKIAFIGLGNMGGGMAANLARAGHTVRAFDLAEAALRGDVMHSDEATERIAFDRQRRCRQRLRKGPKPLRVGK